MKTYGSWGNFLSKYYVFHFKSTLTRLLSSEVELLELYVHEKRLTDFNIDWIVWFTQLNGTKKKIYPILQIGIEDIGYVTNGIRAELQHLGL